MLVENEMTSSPVAVKASSTVLEAAEIMLANRISGLPVVDDNGVLVGMLTETDFLRRHELDTDRKRTWLQGWFTSPGTIADEYVRTHGRLVEEVMSSPVIAITPEAMP